MLVAHRSSLGHQQVAHPDRLKDAEKKNYTCKFEECAENFCRLDYLGRHYMKKHGVRKVKGTGEFMS